MSGGLTLEMLQDAFRAVQEQRPRPHYHMTSATRMKECRAGEREYIVCVECRAPIKCPQKGDVR